MHVEGQAVERVDLGRAGPARAAVGCRRLPELAVDEDEAARPYDALHADDLLRPDAHRACAGSRRPSTSRTPRSRRCRAVAGHDQRDRRVVRRRRLVEERRQTDRDRDQARQRQRAVRGDVRVDDEQRRRRAARESGRPTRAAARRSRRARRPCRPRRTRPGGRRPDGRSRSRGPRVRRGRAARRCSGRSASRGSA